MFDVEPRRVAVTQRAREEDRAILGLARLEEASQQRASAEVREVRWQVSEHVGHLRKHPEEYTAALLGFLRSCTTV